MVKRIAGNDNDIFDSGINSELSCLTAYMYVHDCIQASCLVLHL